jgi:hypothetical protein
MALLQFRKWVIYIFFVGAAGMLSLTPASAACYAPQAQLPAATLTDFTKSPASILKLSNAELISKVRDLVASSPETLQLILALIGSATPAQVDAIGTGLGQAALICVRTDQPFATEIQNAVVALANSALTLAFTAVLGDRPIGSVGGGAGGGGGFSAGAGGGQTNPIGVGLFVGSASIFASASTKNTGTNYFTSSSASASGAPLTTTTATSVSPTR